jgi:arginase
VVAALKPALDQLRTRCSRVFIHMDADSIDPSLFRNFKFRPNITGMEPSVVEQAFNLIADQFEILAFDLSAFDPVPDTRGPSVLSAIMLEAARAAARSRKQV